MQLGRLLTVGLDTVQWEGSLWVKRKVSTERGEVRISLLLSISVVEVVGIILCFLCYVGTEGLDASKGWNFVTVIAVFGVDCVATAVY